MKSILTVLVLALVTHAGPARAMQAKSPTLQATHAWVTEKLKHSADGTPACTGRLSRDSGTAVFCAKLYQLKFDPNSCTVDFQFDAKHLNYYRGGNGFAVGVRSESVRNYNSVSLVGATVSFTDLRIGQRASPFYVRQRYESDKQVQHGVWPKNSFRRIRQAKEATRGASIAKSERMTGINFFFPESQTFTGQYYFQNIWENKPKKTSKDERGDWTSQHISIPIHIENTMKPRLEKALRHYVALCTAANPANEPF